MEKNVTEFLARNAGWIGAGAVGLFLGLFGSGQRKEPSLDLDVDEIARKTMNGKGLAEALAALPEEHRESVQQLTKNMVDEALLKAKRTYGKEYDRGVGAIRSSMNELSTKLVGEIQKGYAEISFLEGSLAKINKAAEQTERNSERLEQRLGAVLDHLTQARIEAITILFAGGVGGYVFTKLSDGAHPRTATLFVVGVLVVLVVCLLVYRVWNDTDRSRYGGV